MKKGEVVRPAQRGGLGDSNPNCCTPAARAGRTGACQPDVCLTQCLRPTMKPSCLPTFMMEAAAVKMVGRDDALHIMTCAAKHSRGRH